MQKGIDASRLAPAFPRGFDQARRELVDLHPLRLAEAGRLDQGPDKLGLVGQQACTDCLAAGQKRSRLEVASWLAHGESLTLAAAWFETCLPACAEVPRRC